MRGRQAVIYQNAGPEAAGLAYSTETLAELIAKDSNNDGRPDWQDNLLPAGTEPAVPPAAVNENLSETDKFARELFASVAALNQAGAMNEVTAEALGQQLAGKIRAEPQRKIFKLGDLKISDDSAPAAYKKYDEAIAREYNKNPVNGNAYDILRRATGEEGEIDSAVLLELDGVINPFSDLVAAMQKISVPRSLAIVHLDYMNAMQRVVENLEDVQKVEIDAMIALAGIMHYEESSEILQAAGLKFAAAIEKSKQ